jgi:sarcosine oxidase gamma subunit
MAQSRASVVGAVDGVVMVEVSGAMASQVLDEAKTR